MRLTDTGLKNQPISALPFVRMNRGAPSLWCVKPTDDYAKACRLGREYAALLALYLRENPSAAGLLPRVIAAMNHCDDAPTKGYRVGFLHHWEHITTARPEHLMADLYVENARHVVPC